MILLSTDKRLDVEKNNAAKFRAVHIKYDSQLKNLPDFYSDKIKTFNQFIAEEKEKYAELISIARIEDRAVETLSEIVMAREKIARMKSKQLAVLGEIDLREKGIASEFNKKDDPFFRKFIGTTYYIDLTAGNDGNTGLSIAQAWRTLEKYTTLTVRTPGDIAYVRANTTEIPAGVINIDEDGDEDDLISIVGCNATQGIDPWADGSDVRPNIDFNGLGNRLHFANDDYWNVKNIKFENTIYAFGTVYIQSSDSIFFENCKFADCTADAVRLNQSSKIYFIDCAFEGNSVGIRMYYGKYKFTGCTFDNNSYGMVQYNPSCMVELINCLFGQTTPNPVYDIWTPNEAQTTRARNSKWNKIYSDLAVGSYIFSEDDQQIAEANIIYGRAGTITKDTTIVRPGGGESSALFEPNSNCGLYQPLEMHENSEFAAPFKFWLIKDVATTLTVYIRASAAWAGYPTATELYAESSYLNHATNPTRAEIQSTAVLPDGSTWVPFTMIFMPLQTGFAYVDVWLKLYEAGKGINVDVKPICSQEGVGNFEWSGGKPFVLMPQTDFSPTVGVDSSIKAYLEPNVAIKAQLEAGLDIKGKLS